MLHVFFNIVSEYIQYLFGLLPTLDRVAVLTVMALCVWPALAVQRWLHMDYCQ